MSEFEMKNREIPTDYSPLWYADRKTFEEAQLEGFTEATLGIGDWFDKPKYTDRDQIRSVRIWIIRHPDGRSMAIDHQKVRTYVDDRPVSTLSSEPALLRFNDPLSLEQYLEVQHVTRYEEPIEIAEINTNYQLQDMPLVEIETS